MFIELFDSFRINHSSNMEAFRRVSTIAIFCPLVEETNDLASNVLPPGLLVVENTGGSGEDDETELTRGKKLNDPLLKITELDVVAGADDTGLVDSGIHVRQLLERKD